MDIIGRIREQRILTERLAAIDGDQYELWTCGEFAIDKKYATELDNKVDVFRAVTGTKKILITTHGTRKNEHYLGRIQAEILMEDLFA